jgi:acetylornithine/N-succinyldiaminopimelate aminotransferase
MRLLGHVSNLFAHEPGIALARALTEATGYERVFFCNSGAEGIDSALKFARARAHALERPGRTLVSFTGGFHGRTGFALSTTWNPSYRAPFEPLVPGVRFLPYGDVAALAEGIDADTCGVIVEPIQGESGAVPAPKGFLAAVRKRCDAVGALLIFDEVQSGMGRTGHFLAATHSGVRADITVLSKALGGGLPLAAVLLTAEASAPLAAGMHGTTFGGNPVAAAAGLWMVGRVNRPTVLARVRRRGKRLQAALKALVAAHPGILTEARGLGLLTAVEIATGAPFGPKDLVDAARAEGLLIVRGGDRAVRVLPPLDVDDATLDEGVALLDRAVSALVAAARPQGAAS